MLFPNSPVVEVQAELNVHTQDDGVECFLSRAK